MDHSIKLRRLAIIPTLRCSLKCKLCSNYIPYFEHPEDVPVCEIEDDIRHIFQLIDYTEWLQFVGGEIFMRRDLWKIYDYCLKYRNQFSKLILITNATVIPCKEDIDIIKEYGDSVEVQISDYGTYSYKIQELKSLLEENKIPYVVKKYHGDMQHYGGWVDNTRFFDRGKSEDELKYQFEHCGQVAMQNFHVYRGMFHGCARSLLASTLGKITPAERDVLDLNDHSIPDEVKREKIKHFNDSPRVSCRSCVSFGENTERYPAAEQVI